MINTRNTHDAGEKYWIMLAQNYKILNLDGVRNDQRNFKAPPCRRSIKRKQTTVLSLFQSCCCNFVALPASWRMFQDIQEWDLTLKCSRYHCSPQIVMLRQTSCQFLKIGGIVSRWQVLEWRPMPETFPSAEVLVYWNWNLPDTGLQPRTTNQKTAQNCTKS